MQKATQNPVSTLVSVPVQNSANFDNEPLDRTQDTLNIQPVVPLIPDRISVALEQMNQHTA